MIDSIAYERPQVSNMTRHSNSASVSDTDIREENRNPSDSTRARQSHALQNTLRLSVINFAFPVIFPTRSCVSHTFRINAERSVVCSKRCRIELWRQPDCQEYGIEHNVFASHMYILYYSTYVELRIVGRPTNESVYALGGIASACVYSLHLGIVCVFMCV